MCHVWIIIVEPGVRHQLAYWSKVRPKARTILATLSRRLIRTSSRERRVHTGIPVGIPEFLMALGTLARVGEINLNVYDLLLLVHCTYMYYVVACVFGASQLVFVSSFCSALFHFLVQKVL